MFLAVLSSGNMAAQDYVAVSLLEENDRFSKALQPLTTVAFFFGSSAIYESPVSVLSIICFYVLFSFMLGVASIGVFLRTEIDIWIQFSLYVIPIVAVLCCSRFFNSAAFRELLFRCIPSRAMLSSSIPDDVFTSTSEIADGRFSSVSRKRKWLRNMAYKACLYPIFYELIQWGSYVFFKFETASHNFAGNANIREKISDLCWIILYTIFWTVGLYIVGMFTFQYILVTYIIRRDAISFMSLFGDSPFLFVKKSHAIHRNVKDKSLLFSFLRCVTGVVLMDAIEDKNDLTNFRAYYSVRKMSGSRHISSTFPARMTPVLDENFDQRESGSAEKGEDPNPITEEEASKMLAHFVADITEITSYFTPFTTALLFFSFTNLVTHLCIFALKKDKTATQYIWTLVRTVIWLLMTVRIIVAAARVTSTLGKIMPHVKYLRATGSLHGQDNKWDNFLVLASHFNLGEQTFGFPLTLKQIGILVAFLKMTFLVVLSVMKVPGLDID